MIDNERSAGRRLSAIYGDGRGGTRGKKSSKASFTKGSHPEGNRRLARKEDAGRPRRRRKQLSPRGQSQRRKRRPPASAYIRKNRSSPPIS